MIDKISHNQDTLVWCKYNEKIHPAVSQVAKIYISVVATNVPCKRLFSESIQVITKRKKSVIIKQSKSTIFYEFIFRRKCDLNKDNVMV